MCLLNICRNPPFIAFSNAPHHFCWVQIFLNMFLRVPYVFQLEMLSLQYTQDPTGRYLAFNFYKLVCVIIFIKAFPNVKIENTFDENGLIIDIQFFAYTKSNAKKRMLFFEVFKLFGTCLEMSSSQKGSTLHLSQLYNRRQQYFVQFCFQAKNNGSIK